MLFFQIKAVLAIQIADGINRLGNHMERGFYISIYSIMSVNERK